MPSQRTIKCQWLKGFSILPFPFRANRACGIVPPTRAAECFRQHTCKLVSVKLPIDFPNVSYFSFHICLCQKKRIKQINVSIQAGNESIKGANIAAMKHSYNVRKLSGQIGTSIGHGTPDWICNFAL